MLLHHKHAVRWELIKTCLHLSSWCLITVFPLCWTCNDICAQGLTTAVLMAQRANPMHSIPYNPNMPNKKHPISPPTHTYTALSVSEFKLVINSWMRCLMNNTKYPWDHAWWNPAFVHCALTTQTLPWLLQIVVHFKMHSRSHVYTVKWETERRESMHI